MIKQVLYISTFAELTHKVVGRKSDHFININISHFKREPAENNHVSENVAKEDLVVTIDDTDVTPNMAAFNNAWSSKFKSAIYMHKK